VSRFRLFRPDIQFPRASISWRKGSPAPRAAPSALYYAEGITQAYPSLQRTL
jgi:hypothetical protein